MFYISSHKYKGSVEVLGVTDTDDNIEEFYTKEYLLSTGLEIIRLNKELEIGYKFKTKCFEFRLIEIDGMLGWRLSSLSGISNFRNKSYYLGYPVISLVKCFEKRKFKDIDLKGMDTSQVLYMACMFDSCESLESLDLSNFDTSKVTDMLGMFRDCESLESLDLSNFDTSKVTDMRGMFRGCLSLTSLDVSNFDTSRVTSMRGMFWECQKLTSLDVSNFDTSKVTDMEEMFSNCYNLTLLDVSNFDTRNVINMKYMFRYCESLVYLDVSNFDTSKVTDMSRMFGWCKGVVSLDLSNFDTSHINNIFMADGMSEMFIGCNKLGLVYVSSSKLLGKLPSNAIAVVSKSLGIKYDKLFRSKKDIAKYSLMLSNYKVVAYEEE